VNPRVFQCISWIPLAILLVLQLYVRELEGWGRWASAPLFLLPVVLSAVLVPVGIRLWRHHQQVHISARSLGLATLLASIPALWFLARALFA